MKKYIALILVVGLTFTACENLLQQEINEVDALLLIVKETENSLLLVDTSRVFEVKRKMVKDLAELDNFNDTLTREEAFRLGDIFASKNKIFRLKGKYGKLINQIEFSRKQLNNLKQDLENKVMKKEDFKLHYDVELTAVKELEMTLKKSIQGLEGGMQKYELDRKELFEIIEGEKHKFTNE